MKVKDLMTSKVISVKPETSISEVADLLFHYHFTGVPVVASDGKLLGVIAERDFIASDSKIYLPTYIKLLTEMDYIRGDKGRLPEAARKIINAKAEDIMNKEVVTTYPEMDITELAELFATKRVNPIPVVDGSGVMVGIISRSDLIKLFSHGPQVAAFSPENFHRAIDTDITAAQKDVKTKFAYVAKFRANIWMTTAIVLFVIGFVAGIIYVVDPNYFSSPDDEVEQTQQYEDLFEE